MFRILRATKLFSSEKLRSLKSLYESSPEQFEPAYKYIRQLLRQGKTAQAFNLINNLPDQLKNKQKIKELKEISLNRLDAYLKSNMQSQRKQQFWAITMATLILAAWWGFGTKLRDSLQSSNEEKKTKKKTELIDVVKQQSPTMFSDVRGIDEFKEQLLEIVDFIKNSEKYRKVGAKLPRGILMVGPPGTGKTMMARALANEAGCSFIYRSGSEFDEMFVGLGAQRVREMFEEARRKSPSIIFIDEIDSVAGKRSNNLNSKMNDTINQLLAEMDGFKATENIVVIGATNLESALDPAIKRAGRFDKIISIPLPDIRGRQDIFNLYLQKIRYGGTTARQLAKRTYGFSGADIQNMVNQAVVNCVKNGRFLTTDQDFEFAYDRIVMGVGRKNMYVSEKDKIITAYHESGHTIVALLTEGATPLHKVTVLPRGGALGFTSMVPESDNLSYTKKQLLAMIDVTFGGKVAEEIFMGNMQVTSGSSNDLQKASELAYSYVKKLGMMQSVSLIVETDGVRVSSDYTYILDREVQKILQSSYERVKTLLQKNKDKLSHLATELIKKQTLNSQEVKNLLKI